MAALTNATQTMLSFPRTIKFSIVMCLNLIDKCCKIGSNEYVKGREKRKRN
jgi:hypothetical protein